MQPAELRSAGETIAALEPDPNVHDWREALARGLNAPLAEIESYARGERPVPAELGQRIAQLLQELGRRMSEPGRLMEHARRRNETTGSDRSAEERQQGPLSPAETGDDASAGAPPAPKRAK